MRFRWLQDLYEANIEDGHFDYAARAFLLHLVGCTIFADKSATYADVALLELFRDLKTCGKYAWGASALAYMYDQLNDASMHHTKQMAGYMTLLQVSKFVFYSLSYRCLLVLIQLMMSMLF